MGRNIVPYCSITRVLGNHFGIVSLHASHSTFDESGADRRASCTIRNLVLNIVCLSNYDLKPPLVIVNLRSHCEMRMAESISSLALRSMLVVIS